MRGAKLFLTVSVLLSASTALAAEGYFEDRNDVWRNQGTIPPEDESRIVPPSFNRDVPSSDLSQGEEWLPDSEGDIRGRMREEEDLSGGTDPSRSNYRGPVPYDSEKSLELMLENEENL